MEGLEGKVAIVTGAGRGLGKAICTHLVAGGARVLATDIDPDAVEAVAAELGDNASAFTHDVGDPESWTAALAAAAERFGPVQLLVNNAGVATVGPAVALTVEEVERVIRVNQIGPWLGMRAAIPVMEEGGGGAIVNIASIDGRIGTPGLSHYVGTKHAVVGMTKSVALECAEMNIRINAVSPGGMDTDLVRSLNMPVDFAALMASKTPMKRGGDPAEVGKVVAFLLSDGASYITGADYAVDGGLTAGMALVT